MQAAHGEAGWAGERGHGEQGGLSASEEAPAGGLPDSSVGGHQTPAWGALWCSVNRSR